MAKVELELREDIVQNVIEISLMPSAFNALLGLFSDVPEMMDAVVEDAFSTREKDSLRQIYG